MKALPNTLVLHLKRFDFDMDILAKVIVFDLSMRELYLKIELTCDLHIHLYRLR